jgi:tetratricopeptide (TPR) repeat protein
MTLPAAILLSSTVALVSAAGVFAANTAGDQKDEPAVVLNKAIGKPKPDPTLGKVPLPTKFIDGKSGFMFKFPTAEDKSEPVVVDPQADIEKARALHLAAMDLYKQGKVDEAKAKEKEATTIAPHYWLPHAGLTYIFADQKKPFEALQSSQLAVYGKHGAVADRNAGRLFEIIHWFEPAILEFKKAIKEEPDAWVSYTGLADCYIIQGQYPEAAQVLDRMPTAALSQFEPLSETATRYMQIGEYQKAQDDFAKALDMAPDEAKQQVKDRLYCAAVQTDDKKVLAEFLPQISDTLKTSKPDVMLQAKIDLAANPADADAVLQEAAAFQGNQPDQLFYVIGLKLAKRADESSGTEQTEWLKRANIAFQNSVSRNNTNLKFQLAVASIAERLGNKEVVSQILNTIKESVPPGSDTLKFEDVSPKDVRAKIEDFQKCNLVQAFPVGKASTTAGATAPQYESTARELKLRLTKPSCSCHARSISMEMGHMPGVMYTSYTHESKPALVIVYDSKKTSQKKLMEAKFVTALKEPVDQEGDVPIATLSDLSGLIFAMDRMQMMPVAHPARPGLELPTEASEIAETKPEPAVH